MEKQLFNKGDLVRVAEDLGNSMLHFTNDCAAIIEYSYADRYGGSHRNKLTQIMNGTARADVWLIINEAIRKSSVKCK